MKGKQLAKGAYFAMYVLGDFSLHILQTVLECADQMFCISSPDSIHSAVFSQQAVINGSRLADEKNTASVLHADNVAPSAHTALVVTTTSLWTGEIDDRITDRLTVYLPFCWFG